MYNFVFWRKKLSEFCTQDPSKFLQFSTAELANEKSTPEIRQGCGTLFVRALRMPVNLTIFSCFPRKFLCVLCVF